MELAHRGTLFFDEIAELPMSLQPKLLRALQERRHRRLGGTQIVDFDVRVVSATNRDLRELVSQRQFRQGRHGYNVSQAAKAAGVDQKLFILSCARIIYPLAPERPVGRTVK